MHAQPTALRGPGEVVALRDIARGRLWAARPMTVVSDTDECSALWLVPGATARCHGGHDPEPEHDGLRIGAMEDLARGHWDLVDHVWERSAVLILLEPERWFATWRFYEPDSGAFALWYVNFQEPFRRSHAGFDTLDLFVDLVADRDLAYAWKDEPEWAEALRRGLLSAEQVDGVRKAREEVESRIAARAFPFDGSWDDWSPPPPGPAPELPAGWDVL